MPRAGSIRTKVVAGGKAFEFLELGYTELRTLAEVGTPMVDMAEYFGVSEDWLRKTIEADPFAEAAFKGGSGEGKLAVRRALHEAAVAQDARVLTFVAERRLGMNKVVEQRHDHTHRVIGAMPKGKLTANDWLQQYGPAQLPAPSATDNVIDAEVTEVESQAGAADNGEPTNE